MSKPYLFDAAAIPADKHAGNDIVMADREPGAAPTADPSGQPRLFGVLPNTLFTVFSRRSRVEDAQLILDLWRAFYADPLVDQPSRKELAGFIDDRILERKYELGEEFTGAETTAGTQMLANLVEGKRCDVPTWR